MAEDESSVRVAVRVRPQIPREVIEMCRICTSVTPDEPQITLSSDRSFTYDYVFDMDADQTAVYESCVRNLVEGALEGYNATVLAYGQTGSGKTYTMGTGFEVEVQEGQMGILPRAIAQLFAGIKERIQNARQNSEPAPEFKIDAQFMELYNDEIIDLLDSGYMARVKGIKIHEDIDGVISVKGLINQSVTSAAEALNLLRQGALSRTTGATQMNSQSSRSHAIFTLIIKQQRLVKIEDCDSEDAGKSEFATLSAKFHFVDLAGSERLKRTQATGERAREGISINAGLFALGNVISALGDKSKKAAHVPYRDSKLTRLLQDSLGGNSQTVMIACISPSDSDFMETLNTLNYANRARNIKNKVMVNQDKSSRTIAILRQQIQDLQVELLEYKQGKRLVSSDGVEVVNDMCHENLLLQTETNNLRTRLKALQETVDALSQRNAELMAEKATGAWVTGGENADIKQFIADYMRQIEELRAKLLESEATSQQLRKAVARQPNLALSPTNALFSSRSIVRSHRKIICQEDTLNLTNTENVVKEDQNFSFSDTSSLIAEAKSDLSKDLETLARYEKREKNGNVEGEESDAEEEKGEEDSDSESSDTEDRRSQYGLEIAEISNEITLKQKLIEELERSQQRMLSMKQHYEDKLHQLQDLIKATQEERDKVLASINGYQNEPSDKVKKVRDEYERKLTDMQREVRRLEAAKKEHARLLREQTQQSSQLRSLKSEVEEMKRIKVNLIRKMKEESQKHKMSELKHTREIAALRKESRRREHQIKSLEAENRVKETVLKRRTEEVTALRSRAVSNMSMRAAGKIRKQNEKSFSPKAAKSHWSKIENSINKAKVSKKSMLMVSCEMERLLKQRESLGKELEQLIKKRDLLRLSPHANANEVRDIQEQIESAQSTMNFIQESISDCQHNVMQMDDTKEEGDTFELQSMMVQVKTLEEGKYLIEKLYHAVVAQATATAQTELNLEMLDAKVQQLTQDNATQNQLLQHLITSHHIASDVETTRPPNSISRSGSDESTNSTRSNSPTQLSQSTNLSKGLSEKLSNSSSDSLIKKRRITALPKDLLFPTNPSVKTEEEPAVIPSKTSYSIMTSSLRLNAPKNSDSTLATPNRKQYPESISPRLPRRAANLSSSKLDMEAAESPPGSPTTYRRFNSREENVFSRLTGGSQTPEPMNDRGIISQYTGKVNPKAPLVCAHVASGHSRAVLTVEATDDLIFTGSKDRTVKVWDLQTGLELQTLPGHPNNVDVVKYCETSRLLFSVSSAYVKVWDLREDPSQCVKTLCSSGLSIQGAVQPTTPSRSLTVPPGEAQLNDIALNNSGRTLYTAAGDRVRVWDIRKFSSTGKLAGGHQAAVMCLAVSKVSEYEDCVVTGSKDHYIKVFEVSGEAGGVFSPKMTLDPPHYDGIQTLALHGDTLFSGSRDMCIKKWDLTRQELVYSINNAHSNWICGLELLPGGERLVSGCRSGVLKVWSVDSCALLGEVKAHNSTINSVAVNSTYLFTASNDSSIRFWKPQAGRPLPEKTSPVKERTSPSLTSSFTRSPRSTWVS